MTPSARCALDRFAIGALQLEKLQLLLTTVLSRNPFYSAKLQRAGVRGARRIPRGICRNVPFTDKSEIVDDQSQYPPFGSNLSYPLERYTRFQQTSGTTGAPIFWLDTPESWEWMVECGLGSINPPTPSRKTGYSFHFRLGHSWDSGWRSMPQLG